MNLSTAYYSSPLGQIKIECSNNFISSIIFLDEEEKNNEEKNLPETLHNCVQQLDEYFSGKRKIFDFPIQQPGTEFQNKIWQLLHNISFGKTISYMTLAKQYGDVKAIRAVASANGKNKLCIVIPCHRVIGSNAKLTGYAGGLWRKQWLLEHEAKHHSGVQQLF